MHLALSLSGKGTVFPIKLVYTSCREHRGYSVAQLADLLPAEAGTHLPTPEGWTAQLAGARERYTATAQLLLRNDTSVNAESAPRPPAH